MTINNDRLIFILPLLSGGGAERVLINILKGLHNNGHSVGIIVFKKSGPLLSLIPNEVPIYDLGTPSLKRSIFALVYKIWKIRPRVIFSTLGYINVSLLAIRWILPSKTEIWTREANLPSISLPYNEHPKLMNILYQLLYKKANKIICTSKKMKYEFISDFSVPESAIEVLPNPVDYEKIRFLASPIKRFDNGGVCYVAAGRLTFQKGFDRLLFWFSKINNKKSTLTILGDGDLKNELIEKAMLLKLNDRVKFEGFHANPWQWYAGADVFLLPSRWEGMPNSVLESLTCGTPVIATRESGGIEEIVKEKDNSIIVANEEQEFIHNMNNVNIKNKGFVSKSLLPERHKIKSIINIIEGWLNESK